MKCIIYICILFNKKVIRNMIQRFVFFISAVALFAACGSEDEQAPKPAKPVTTLEEALIARIPLNGDATGTGPAGVQGSVNGATPVAGRDGKAGSALSFDGVDDLVDLGTKVDTDDISTISLWANFDSLNSAMPDMELISKSSYQQGMEIVIYRGSLKFFLVGVEDNNNIGVAITSLKQKQWYHIAAVYDRAAAQMHLYLNGELVVTGRAPAEITKVERMFLGTWNYPEEPRHFKGMLDDVSLYNRPLTEQEIKGLYNSPD